MKRSHFTEQYNISDIQPITISRHPLSCKDLAQVTKSFMDENFGGLVNVALDILPLSAVIIISEEQLICFFKELIGSIYGKEMISIRIELDEDHFKIIIEGDGELPIGCLDANRLTRRAKMAGFKVELCDTALRLYTKHRRYSYYKVYAISADHLYGAFNHSFFAPRVFDVSDDTE